jgi:hypothetical protein
MRPEVDLFVFYTQFGADTVPVEKDRVLGNQQQFGDLLVCIALLDQVGHPDFGRGEAQVARRDPADER